MTRCRYGLLAGVLVLGACGSSDSSTPRTAVLPAIAVEELARGFVSPVYVAGAGDGSGMLYVVEQGGIVRVIEASGVRPTAFLDLSGKVESGGEKGLLGLAFHPAFATNQTFFVNYTARVSGQLYTFVSRLRRDPITGNADPASEAVLLQIQQPYDNHNGGQLAFGPDGYLYVGLGDGGSANDPLNHAQDLGTLLGSVLRIDVDRATAPLPYAIPGDNPFVGQAGRREEIYAYGFRNPWRFSFDAGAGTLYLGDVGQGAREEIDVVVSGGNYGWRIMEGDICTPGVNSVCNTAGFIPPIHVYATGTLGRSVTGGYVYRGSRHPTLAGLYFFGDYVSGRIFALRYDGRAVTQQGEVLASGINISSFGQGDDLELYVADHSGGRVLRIVPAP